MKKSKKEVYAAHGIEYSNGKIFCPCLDMWIAPLLVNGNAKLGKGVYTFSTLPSNQIFHVTINGRSYDIKGTCLCNCPGCYAQRGFYNMPSTVLSNAIKTYIVYNDLRFFVDAVIAQIEADDIELCRIHASGDFFNNPYVLAWVYICHVCKSTTFWSYTKSVFAEHAFDYIPNCNIVKSLIDTAAVKGVNFGHCDYIRSAYNALQSEGKTVHICRCGIDKNQHCNGCTACSKNEYVLFIEHSTEYKAEADPVYADLKAIIDTQQSA